MTPPAEASFGGGRIAAPQVSAVQAHAKRTLLVVRRRKQAAEFGAGHRQTAAAALTADSSGDRTGLDRVMRRSACMAPARRSKKSRTSSNRSTVGAAPGDPPPTQQVAPVARVALHPVVLAECPARQPSSSRHDEERHERPARPAGRARRRRPTPWRRSDGSNVVTSISAVSTTTMPRVIPATAVLVDRLWPWGVTKADAAVDQWPQEAAPAKHRAPALVRP